MTNRCLYLLAAFAMVSSACTFAADNMPPAGPDYTPDGQLRLPAGYREWVFLSSGLGMSYSDKAPDGEPAFDNTFVDPESYRAFVRTGRWPDHAQIVLEVRASTAQGSINRHGRYQSGGVQGVEIHVKDTARFKGGWAFFSFDGGSTGKKVPQSAACYACHAAHGAVDTTFVQFYPTLLPVARHQATLTAEFLKEEAAAH